MNYESPTVKKPKLSIPLFKTIWIYLQPLVPNYRYFLFESIYFASLYGKASYTWLIELFILFLFSLSFVLLFVVDNNEVCTIFMKDHLHRTICRYGCHLSCNLNPSGVRWSAGQGIQFGDQEPTEDMRSGTGPQPNTIGWRTLIIFQHLVKWNWFPCHIPFCRIKLTPAVERFWIRVLWLHFGVEGTFFNTFFVVVSIALPFWLFLILYLSFYFIIHCYIGSFVMLYVHKFKGLQSFI